MSTVEEPTIQELLMSAPMWYVLGAWVFLLGLMVGSFLNVAIYRLPLGMSVNNPKRSFCWRCGTMIRWHDNIPVLSWILLGGRDRACGARISPRYAVVELLTGILFLLLWLAYNPLGGTFAPLTIWYAAFIACLIVGTFTDLDHWIIPSSIPRWGTAAALVAALLSGFVDKSSLIATGGPFPGVRAAGGDWLDTTIAIMMGSSWVSNYPVETLWWEPFANAVVGAVFAPLMVYGVGVLGKIAFRKEAMGFGDVELFAMIGATVGAMNSIVVLVLAAFFGAIGGTLAMMRRRDPADSPLALGALPPSASPDTTQLPEPSPEERERLNNMMNELGHAMLVLTGTEADFAGSPLGEVEAHRLGVLVLGRRDGKWQVGVTDPLDTELVTALRASFADDIEYVLIAPSQRDAFWKARDAAPPAGEPPVWRRYYDVASLLPLPRGGSHLPFIPWIALGALVVVVFNGPLEQFLGSLYNP